MQATISNAYGSDEETDAMEDRPQRRDAKRRRVTRKGTHSCWACKRRKEKCTPDPSGGNVCHSCRRRGTKCVSQEFPEEESEGTRRLHHDTRMGDRMQRIETIVEQLLSKLQSNPTDFVSMPGPSSSTTSDLHNIPATQTGFSGFPTPTSLLESTRRSPHAAEIDSTIIPSSHPRSASVEASPVSSSLQDRSKALHRSLPSRQDLQLIRQASSRHPSLLGAHLTRSYTTLQHGGQCGALSAKDGILREAPPQTAHPVLIALYMLRLAILLQDMHHDIHPELRHLSELPSQIIERSANAAMTLVTTCDDLHGSVESLECIMLESVYRCNSGRLRQSWMAARRAMLLAQVMGLHLAVQDGRHTLKILDPKATHVEPRLLWFRIVSFDLLMCRMLGLPPGTAEPCSGPFGANPDTALGHLEHKQCDVMAQILKRKSKASGPPDFETTLLLDQEVQRAAKSVPSDWWLAPHLTESAKDPVTMFWDMRRLLVQINHYDLLNQLYLPYMLAQGQSAMDRQRSNLSRSVCVNASREVLSRFTLLRNFNQVASSCRIVDFTGLMAAITLVLAHLGGRSQFSDNISSQAVSLLSHQAPSDRAMMEQALKNMRQVSQVSGDGLSARSADVLRRLLDIEAQRADSSAAEDVSVQDNLASNNSDIQRGGLPGEDGERVDVPYFGSIRIAREGANPRPMSARTKRLDANSQIMDKTMDRTHVLAPGNAHNNEFNVSAPPLQNYDNLLPGLNDDYLGLQNIHMSFLDNFFDDMPGNDAVYNV